MQASHPNICTFAYVVIIGKTNFNLKKEIICKIKNVSKIVRFTLVAFNALEIAK